MPALPGRTSREGAAARRRRVPLARRFTIRYAVAFVLFGALLAAWRISIDSSAQRIDELNRQVAQAAGQTGRLDRIINLANKITFEPSSANLEGEQSELEQDAALLVRVQDGLLNGDSQLGLPAVALPSELSQLYNEPDRLAQLVRDIGGSARTIAKPSSNQDAKNAQLQLILNNEQFARNGLDKAIKIYTDLTARELRSMDATNTLFTLLTVVLGGFVIIAMFRPMARSIHFETSQLEEAERVHRENNERQTFRNDLSHALEMTESEEEVLAAVERALVQIVPDHPAELLLADPSQAHLRRARVNPRQGAANCPVESPEGCTAIRRGQKMVFESGRMLNVCPKLPEHPGGLCSAVCVPVVFLGRSLGVLHATGPDGEPPDAIQVERLGVLAAETGNRMGTLEVTKATQLQATTDGLTGLFNRRTLESKARGLLMDHRGFSIAMADLDHFKSLNDTHGHEAGDRALRLFASVLTNNLRPNDVPSRYGGEEFVVMLPNAAIKEAHHAIERLQSALAEEISRAGMIPFTASWGLTDNGAGETFDEIMAVADAALYSAKRAGRNCIMVDGVAAAAAGWTADAGPEPERPAPAAPTDGASPEPAPAAPVPARPRPSRDTATAPTTGGNGNGNGHAPDGDGAGPIGG